MVFSSIPGNHLDPPNWQQQSNHLQQQQEGGVRDHQGSHLLSLPPPPPPSSGGAGDGGGGPPNGTMRPGTMSDRARQAKMPQPEAALKCPRCESINTKFCYFNNYSLTQPRHFCKTCRRYWTRGGALRSVPVGGGCRRNKRIKRSKSPASSASAPSHHHRAGSSSSTVSNSNNSCSTSENLLGHLAPPQFPFLPSSHHLSDYSSGGLNFGGIQQPSGVQFLGASGSGGVGSIFSNGLAEHWRSSLQNHQVQQGQQFPFFANLEPPNSHGLYQFEVNNQNNAHEESPSYGSGSSAGQVLSKPLVHSINGVTQVANVKMEESQALNLSRNFLGSLGNDHNQQYWGTSTTAGGHNAWTDLSGFTSSTSHLL